MSIYDGQVRGKIFLIELDVNSLENKVHQKN